MITKFLDTKPYLCRSIVKIGLGVLFLTYIKNDVGVASVEFAIIFFGVWYGLKILKYKKFNKGVKSDELIIRMADVMIKACMWLIVDCTRPMNIKQNSNR